jgi:hypothetical protein
MQLGVVVTSVEIEWYGGRSTARCFTLKFLEAYVVHVNLRPGGAIRGKWRTIGWEGMCCLRTEGLVPTSKY